MDTISKAGSKVSVPTSLIDQLQRMTKKGDVGNQVAPKVPSPAPRPTPAPGLSS